MVSETLVHGGDINLMIAKKNIILGLVIEALFVGSQFWLNHFQLESYYFHLFYFIPYFFLKSHIAAVSIDGWAPYVAWVLFYFLNSFKWSLLAWKFSKGSRILTSLVALILVALMFISFPFSDLQF